MAICIECKDVSYAYPLTKKAAVRHLSCTFETGKTYGVIGPNASGKTTLCNLLMGLCPNFYSGKIKGEVIIDGKPMSAWDEGDLAVHIGYVFQDPFAQVSGIKDTVFEEIGIGLENLGVPQEEMIERICRAAELVKVDSLLQKHPLALSGGQAQRVAFASVLVLDSDIIIIDEPTSQLDPQGTLEVFEIIKSLRELGKTVIVAEHKLDLLVDYCDEIIAMDHGEIVLQGPTRDVLSDPRLPEHDIQVPQAVQLAAALEKAGKPIGAMPINQREAIELLSKRRKG